MQSNRLERSNTNRVISGVCGGIAEYLAIDATLVRAVFVVLTLIGGVGILAYIVLLILMPQPGRPAPFTSSPSSSSSASSESGDPAATTPTSVAPVDPAARAAEHERRRMAVGYLLIGVGVVFLLSNMGLRFFQWQYVWPVVLIGIGVLFLLQRVRS